MALRRGRHGICSCVLLFLLYDFQLCAATDFCYACQAGTYCFLETQYQCPEHAISSSQSGNISDCICTDSYYEISHDTGECARCQPGFFCVEEKSHACPAHTISHEGSFAPNHCLCVEGYTLSGYQSSPQGELPICTQCVGGKFKEQIGFDVCSDCEAGKYSTTIGSTSNASCLNCPINHGSNAGSDLYADCVSNVGFYQNETLWNTLQVKYAEVCPPGTYQDEVGRFECKRCEDLVDPGPAQTSPPNSDSASDCIYCFANSFIYSTLIGNIADCTCNSGYYTQSNQVCAQCPAGKYSDTNNVDECLSCSENQYSLSGAKTCEDCSVNSHSAVGSTSIQNCICNLGFGGSSGSCTTCDPGYFTLISGLEATCTACYEDHYMLGLDCTECPINSFSPRFSTSLSDCACNIGYEQKDDQVECEICAVGKFYDTGTKLCTACAPDTYNAVPGATQCISCPTGSYTNGAENAHTRAMCLCRKGFEGQIYETSGSCVGCAYGKYKALVGNGLCEVCDSGTYSDEIGSLECTSCMANSYSEIGAGSANDCICFPEFEKINDECVGCKNGYFKNESGNFACIPCPVGMYADWDLASVNESRTKCFDCPVNTYQDLTASNSCKQCIANSFSGEKSTKSEQCLCGPGFFKNDDSSCVQCASGYFKTVVSDDACQKCPAGYTTLTSGTTSDSACVPCNATEYEVDGVCVQCYENSTSEVGSSDVTFCTCKAGYYKYSSSKCYECEIGSYAPSIGMQQCLLCGAGTVGRILPVGMFRDRNHGEYSACVACSANQYSTDHRQCSDCPAHSTSPVSSSSIEECICDVGYSRIGNECVKCNAGFYKDKIGNDACVECEIGKYQPIIGSTNCLNCPQNKTTVVESSTAIEACLCLPGYEFSSIDNCKLCANGKFKTTYSNNDQCAACSSGTYYPESLAPYIANNCVVCPGGKISSEGAFGVEECVCEAGYYESETQECSACESQFYCTGNNVKTACPMNALSSHPRTLESHCHCKSGFYTQDGICKLCPVNSYCSGVREFVDGKFVQVAISCPVNSTTLTKPGQVSLRNCICDSGFYRENDMCKKCPVNMYCYNESKVHCMNNATSLKLSSSVDECKCDAGFEKNRIANGDSDEQCILCSSDKVCHHSANVFKIRFRVTLPMLPNAVTDEIKVEILIYFSKVLKIETYRIVGLFSQMKIFQGSSRRLLADQTEILLEVESETLEDSNDIQQSIQHLSSESYNFESEYVSSVTITSTYQDEMQDEVCAMDASEVSQKCICADGKYCNFNGSCSGVFSQCLDCVAGSYCSHNLITACPSNFLSPAKSTTFQNCFCMDGYYRKSVNECAECPENNYCKNGNKTQCSVHDTNLVSLAGSTVWEDCICRPGYFRISPYDLCKPCPLDHFCPGEAGHGLPNILACPENEFTYEIKQFERIQCICIAGFVLSESENTMKCLPCQEGERCSAGQVLETQCHVQNRIANADHTKCVCHIGYEQSANGVCEPCGTGKYKSDIGDHLCEFCPPNQIMQNDICVHCQEFSTARPGDTECICQAPRVLVNGTCQLCEENYVWSGQNIANAAGYVHPVCVVCPLHSSTESEFGVTNMNSCLCSDGYVRGLEDAPFCVPCPENTYEQDGVCVSCGENALSAVGSHGKMSCFCNTTLCQVNVFSDICSEKCENPPNACTECPPGQFKSYVSSTGNNDRCVLCGYASYQPEIGQTSCVHCPETRTHSILESVTVQDCECDKGYEDRDVDLNSLAQCYECNLGFYKGIVGNHECLPCGIGLFSDSMKSTICNQCSEFSSVAGANTTKEQASISVHNCTCSFGLFKSEENECRECVSGSFKNFKGYEECVFCGTSNEQYNNYLLNKYGDNSVGAVHSDHCLECPVNSGQNHELVPDFFVMSEFESCLCFPGFHQRNQTRCVPCDDKQIQPGFSLEDCKFCDSGQYFVASNLFCPTCSLTFEPKTEYSLSNYTNTILNNSLEVRHSGFVLNSLDPSLPFGDSELDCICDVGYERKFFLSYIYDCILCPAGSSRGSQTQRYCSECDTDTFMPHRGSLECLKCPSHSSTLNLTGADNILDCVCDLGFFWNSTHCVPCEAGTYRNEIDIENEPTTCNLCPPDHYCPENSVHPIACSNNEFSLSNSKIIEDCKCVEGHGRSVGSALCAACSHGFYSGRGDNTCETCPQHKNTSQVGSSVINQCLCIPGYGQYSSAPTDPCVICGDGFYAPGGDNIPCYSCGWGARSDPETAAVSLDQCYCDGSIGVREL